MFSIAFLFFPIRITENLQSAVVILWIVARVTTRWRWLFWSHSELYECLLFTSILMQLSLNTHISSSNNNNATSANGVRPHSNPLHWCQLPKRIRVAACRCNAPNNFSAHTSHRRLLLGYCWRVSSTVQPPAIYEHVRCTIECANSSSLALYEWVARLPVNVWRSNDINVISRVYRVRDNVRALSGSFSRHFLNKPAFRSNVVQYE